MFERYTERARRVIFFARYEASSFGSAYIEPEHLLLGVLRESGDLRGLMGPSDTENVRRAIEQRTPRREKISTSVDMPLSEPSKQALAHGAAEGERLRHWHITELHLLLGILRLEDSFAAQLLKERSVTAAVIQRLMATLAGPEQTHVLPEVTWQTTGVITNIIGLAQEEAEKLQQPLLPEHLLLGLLRQGESRGAAILIENGLTLEAVRAKLQSS